MTLTHRQHEDALPHPIGPSVLGRVFALAGIGGALVSLGTGLLTDDRAHFVVAIALCGFVAWLLLIGRLAADRDDRWVRLFGTGVLVFMVVYLPVMPVLALTIAPVAVFPVSIAVPYLEERALRRFAVSAWVFGTAYALIAGMATGDPSPHGVGTWVLQALATSLIIALVLALIVLYARANAEARFWALHDSLTGLPGRHLFMDRLDQALRRGERRPTRTAVIYLDLDGFKAINDRLGHDQGDRMLRSFAERLRSAVRAGDTAARLGGDEFAILLESVADRSEAEAVARRVQDGLADPTAVADSSTPIRASIGISLSRDGETPDGLLRSADEAMYRSKLDRRGAVVVFDPGMRTVTAERGAQDRGGASVDVVPAANVAPVPLPRRAVRGGEVIRTGAPGRAAAP